jgi:hypothetical protein
MQIDITQLSEDQLIALNHQIVERLSLMQQLRVHAKMLDFRVGEQVAFQPDGRPVLFGVLTRYNKKTVTVVTDGGEHWNVSPSLLRKVTETSSSKVVQLPRK